MIRRQASRYRGANVTGLGVVSCLGTGAEAVVDAALDGGTGLAKDAVWGGVTGKVGDELLRALREELVTSGFASRWLGAEDLSSLVRAKPLIMMAHALMQAVGPQADLERELAAGTGLIFATTTGHMANWEHDLPRFVAGGLSAQEFAPVFRDYHLSRSLDALIQGSGFTGPFQMLTSACAAGTQALILAHKWLRSGKVRRCLVGTTEALTTMTVRGFGCFEILSPGVTAPFDRQRDGINLGEAAVFFCLDANSEPPGHGFVLGGATTLDAFDMTSPHPEGRGIHQAMERALADSGQGGADVDWIYAHGTGTQANDAAEGAAIARLFGPAGPLVSSTKGVHGHALAASGLLETAVALTAMGRGILLPSANLREPDPSLGINLARRPVKRSLATVLKTTLGFGGVNAAVVLGKEGRS